MCDEELQAATGKMVLRTAWNCIKQDGDWQNEEQQQYTFWVLFGLVFLLGTLYGSK